MFTGIIEESGRVREIRKTASGIRLTVRTRKTHGKSRIGSSVCVEGVCLTLVQKKEKDLSFDVSKNSLRQTTLGNLQQGDSVNLERPLKIGDRVGGHFVQGHVDGVGVITDRRKEGKNLLFQVKCPRPILSTLVPRGSIAVNGVSLTVTALHRDCFGLYLVPHTLKATDLANQEVGDEVNLEVDLLSKLILRKRDRLRDSP